MKARVREVPVRDRRTASVSLGARSRVTCEWKWLAGRLTLFRKEGHVLPQVGDGSFYTLADTRVCPSLLGQATAAGRERFEQRRPTRERRRRRLRLRLGGARFGVGIGIGLAAGTLDVLRYGCGCRGGRRARWRCPAWVRRRGRSSSRRRRTEDPSERPRCHSRGPERNLYSIAGANARRLCVSRRGATRRARRDQDRA